MFKTLLYVAYTYFEGSEFNDLLIFLKNSLLIYLIFSEN